MSFRLNRFPLKNGTFDFGARITYVKKQSFYYCYLFFSQLLKHSMLFLNCVFDNIEVSLCCNLLDLTTYHLDLFVKNRRTTNWYVINLLLFIRS